MRRASARRTRTSAGWRSAPCWPCWWSRRARKPPWPCAPRPAPSALASLHALQVLQLTRLWPRGWQMEMEMVEPLVTLLDDESEETRVNVVAVIRSICDHPAGRALFSRHEVAVSQQWMDLFPSVVVPN